MLCKFGEFSKLFNGVLNWGFAFLFDEVLYFFDVHNKKSLLFDFLLLFQSSMFKALFKGLEQLGSSLKKAPSLLPFLPIFVK